MKDIDVTTIFSNLLDNAKEAVAECGEERYLSLKMDEAKDFLVICLPKFLPGKSGKRERDTKGSDLSMSGMLWNHMEERCRFRD